MSCASWVFLATAFALLTRKQLSLNGKDVNESYVSVKSDYIDAYRDYLPSEPRSMQFYEPALKTLRERVKNSQVVVPEGRSAA